MASCETTADGLRTHRRGLSRVLRRESGRWPCEAAINAPEGHPPTPNAGLNPGPADLKVCLPGCCRISLDSALAGFVALPALTVLGCDGFSRVGSDLLRTGCGLRAGTLASCSAIRTLIVVRLPDAVHAAQVVIPAVAGFESRQPPRLETPPHLHRRGCGGVRFGLHATNHATRAPIRSR